MKINEVIAEKDKDVSKLELDDQNKKKLFWKDVIKDKTKQHFEANVDGRNVKGYIDTEENVLYVYDEGLNDFVVADPNLVRRIFGKNISARMKKLLNFQKGFAQRWRDWWDTQNPSASGAGQAAKLGDKPFFQRTLGTIGSRAGGRIDKMLAKRKAQKQLGDVWTQVYGVKAPKPGDEIVFKTRDGKVRSATVQMLAINVDRDGDGVPDVVIKGNVNPANPKLETTFTIPSSSVLSVRGQELKPQKGGQKYSTDPADLGIDNPSGDPADLGGNPQQGDPATI